VVDVERFGDVVFHKLEGKLPKVGAQVMCHVDARRRERITQIHTATHIINGSAREVLGPWVWQHSAFKEEDYGRIDITHFAHLTEKEVHKIEDLANSIVRKNLKVTNTFMPRQEAEQKYGFRLYQGGVVPGRLVRVVNIGGWDIEACGGTHTKTTGEVGFIKITKAERIQDGVERLEFVAGESAIEYMHKMDSELQQLSSVVGTQKENLPAVVASLKEELDESRSRERNLSRKVVELSTGESAEETMVSETVGEVIVSVVHSDGLTDNEIIAQGEKVVQAKPATIYVGFVVQKGNTRVICFTGDQARAAGYSASEVVKKLATSLGGSGGGTASFAQGGGPETDPEKVRQLVKSVASVVAAMRA
jgi:alanyl-tRNA synthetase